MIGGFFSTNISRAKRAHVWPPSNKLSEVVVLRGEVLRQKMLQCLWCTFRSFLLKLESIHLVHFEPLWRAPHMLHPKHGSLWAVLLHTLAIVATGQSCMPFQSVKGGWKGAYSRNFLMLVTPNDARNRYLGYNVFFHHLLTRMGVVYLKIQPPRWTCNKMTKMTN